MKIKLTAIVLSLLMITGCGAASSSEAPAEPAYEPSYTYVNPDPGMVLVKHPDGDITYENYRLYMDVTEEMARITARQTMASSVLLENDLKEFGVTIDEQEAHDIAAEQIMMSMYYTPSMVEDMQKVSEILGITAEQASEAMVTGMRSQYLVGLLSEYYTARAAENHPEASGEPATDSGEPSDAQQAIAEEADALIMEYIEKFNDRLTFDDDSVLAVADGKALEYTDEIRRYVDYTAMSARYDAASFIMSGEVVLKLLESSGAEIDRDSFTETFNQNVDQMRSDEETNNRINEICERFGATSDDYYKAFERPLWLQQAGSIYYTNMDAEYAELFAADSGSVPASFDEYFSTIFSAELEKAELVNVAGK